MMMGVNKAGGGPDEGDAVEGKHTVLVKDKGRSGAPDERACLMEGEKELVMDEGSDRRRGKEGSAELLGFM